MANRKGSQFAAAAYTDPDGNWSIIWIDGNNPGVDAGNRSMNKTQLDLYIDDKINGDGSFTTVTINNGDTETIQMGEVAAYEAFEVDAIIGNTTERAKIFKEFVYDGSTLKGYSPRKTGTLDADIDINLQAVAFGQAVWKIKNNSGNTITVKYRVRRFPAI